MQLDKRINKLVNDWYDAKILKESKRFQDTPISKNLHSRMRRAIAVNDQYQADRYAGQLDAAYQTYMYIRCVPSLLRIALEAYPDLPAARRFVTLFIDAIYTEK